MNLKACVAEFVGTLTLIFVGVGAIVTNHLTSASGLTGVALAHGLAIAVMVSATAAVSGGHLNPAVTVAMIVTRNITPLGGLAYIVSQCLGGLGGAALIKLAMPADALTAVRMGNPSIRPGEAPGMAVLVELVLTFFLVFVVFGTAVDKRAPKVGGLFIGLAVTMGVLVGGPVSGGAMNPARHFGPALLGGGTENFWVYWVGPLAGGILAALLYNNVLRER